MTRIFARQFDSGAPFALGEGASQVAVQIPSFNPNGPKIYWWAQAGMVHMWIEPGVMKPFLLDDPTPDYRVLRWEDAAERLQAYADMVVSHRSVNYYPEVRRREEKFCRDMAAVILAAKAQVPPGTEECVKDREARATKTFVFGGVVRDRDK